jgi:DNA-binding response OmpR family regulator
MAKILEIEDDTDLSARVSQWFAREGHTVEIADCGEDGLQLLDNYIYDVILLDWTLPGISGLEVCRRYRKNGGDSWIIFTTGEGDVQHKEEALDHGADDYIVKPFDIRELAARVRGALRRSVTRLEPKLKIDDAVLLADERKVIINGIPHQLTGKETALLEYLFRNPTGVFGTKHLLAAIWPSSSEASEGTIRTIMYTLRAKLEAAGAPNLVKTVLGAGYTVKGQ